MIRFRPANCPALVTFVRLMKVAKSGEIPACAATIPKVKLTEKYPITIARESLAPSIKSLLSICGIVSLPIAFCDGFVYSNTDNFIRLL